MEPHLKQLRQNLHLHTMSVPIFGHHLKKRLGIDLQLSSPAEQSPEAAFIELSLNLLIGFLPEQLREGGCNM